MKESTRRRMNHLITNTFNPYSQRVTWSKEEFMSVMSDLYDESIQAGCTYFDVVINTDADKNHVKEAK